MHGLDDTFSAAELATDLRTQRIGREILVFPQLPSTNDLLRQRAVAGAAEGLVAIADEQTAGRGRLGRRWDAPPRSGLLLSVLLRPTFLTPSESFLLTMLAAVALAEAVAEASSATPRLKWPNDLLLPVGGEWHKAAGILLDLGLAQGRLASAVLGLGLNVYWHPPDTSGGYSTTSLLAAGFPAHRLLLARTLLRHLDAAYLALQAGGRDELFGRWRSLLHTLGRPVRVTGTTHAIEGLAEDVTPEGILLVRDAAGTLHRVVSGDASLR